MAFKPNSKHFRATPVTELLMAENNHVLSVLRPALHGLLDLMPGRADETSLLRHPARAAPALVLHLSDLKPMNDSKRAEALSAFSVLLEHSRRLSNYSEAKHAFWLDVLQSRMTRVVTRNVPDASLREPTFPIFVVSFNDGQYCSYNGYNGSLPSPFVVPEDAIVAFFSTPPIMPTPTQMQFQPRPDVNGPDAIAIELSFTECRLTSIDTIEAVERVLDHVFAHPTRQFAVSALDMSGNSMGPSELAVVARIVCKCRHEYQVSKLRLDGIMSGIRRTPREFLDIVRTAYGIGRSLLPSASTESNTDIVQDVSIRASRLHSVSMSYNDLCPVYFATLFSALRYGNPVHESFSQYYDMVLNYTLCTSWLTFGLFYPRPKRFRKLLGLRNIGDVYCTRDFVETFTKALYNPATLLAHGSVNHTETGAAATELLVCTVKKGASVELIRLEDPKPIVSGLHSFRNVIYEPIQPDTHEVETKCELEGLCIRDSDDAVCVVIPGVGLGWVKREDIEFIERESLEDAWNQQDGQYEMLLTYNEPANNSALTTAMLALVGRQIYSLGFDVHNINTEFSIMPQIIEHCPNLVNLNLRGVTATESEMEDLLDALRTGPLRTRLLTLNLNSSNFFDEKFLQQLVTIIGEESTSNNTSEDQLALQELHLHGIALSLEITTLLTEALLTNRNLQLVQLTRADRYRNTSVYAKQNELREVHDGQLLRRTLPAEAKLAFLSVVNLESSTELDTNLVTHIFHFANSRDVYRVIALTADIACCR